MAVFYSRKSKIKKEEARKEASNLDEEVFCPLCGYEAKLIEIYQDRKSYKCTKCQKISTFTVLPKNAKTGKPKQRKEPEPKGILIRDRSKEVKKEQKEQKIEVEDQEAPKMDPISNSMKNKNVLTFEYISKDGNKSVRSVEPYKVTKDKKGNIILYGFCLAGKGIRVFKLNGMKNIKSTEKPFKPRWPVEDGRRKKKPV